MEPRRGYSSIALLKLLLDNARPLIAVPLVAAVLAGGLTLLIGRDWRAESTFKPQATGADQNRLAGLASQLGVNLGSLSEGESVDFFARLATSRALLTEIAQDTFIFAEREGSADTVSGTPLELYKAKGDTEAERLRNTVDRLGKRTSAYVDVNAGVVTLRTTAPWPGLATQLNRALLEEVSRFNLETRRSQARAEREFTEARLKEARAELEAAEGDLRAFLERNRRYQDSPDLRLQYENLQRRVDLRQQVYTSLAQSYERARVDEVRNTPVLTVIDPPEGSARRTGSLLRNAFFGAVLGLLLVLGWIFLREYLARERATHPDDWAALAERRRASGSRVRSA